MKIHIFKRLASHELIIINKFEMAVLSGNYYKYALVGEVRREV